MYHAELDILSFAALVLSIQYQLTTLCEPYYALLPVAQLQIISGDPKSSNLEIL
jgi:hypothetical protein